MAQSEPTLTEHAALRVKLLAAQMLVRELPKDATNTYDGYAYTSADAIIAEARRVLNESHLIVRRHGWKIEPWLIDGFLCVRSHVVVEDPVGGGSLSASIPYPFTVKRGTQWDKALSAALTTSFAYWLRDLLAIPRTDAEVDTLRADDDPSPTSARTRGRPAGRRTDKRRKDAAQPAKPDPQLDRAFAELVLCVKMFNPDEGRDDDAIRAEAESHITRDGLPVTVEAVNRLAQRVAEKHAPPEDVDQDRQRILDQIASSKWATSAFDELRTSSGFDDQATGQRVDLVEWLRTEGIDLSTAEGRGVLKGRINDGKLPT